MSAAPSQHALCSRFVTCAVHTMYSVPQKQLMCAEALCHRPTGRGTGREGRPAPHRAAPTATVSWRVSLEQPHAMSTCLYWNACACSAIGENGCQLWLLSYSDEAGVCATRCSCAARCLRGSYCRCSVAVAAAEQKEAIAVVARFERGSCCCCYAAAAPN